MGFEIDSIRAINSGFRGDGAYHRKVVKITNAEIKALRASPKVLVPAPGAGWFLLLEYLVLILDYGSNVLTESADNLVVEYESGQDATGAIETTGFIDQAADQMAIILPAAIPTATAANIANKNLRLFNTGDGEFAGNAAADTIMYAIVEYSVHKTKL
jgi:hypothetical protein